jgi:hypothetical protein
METTRTPTAAAGTAWGDRLGCSLGIAVGGGAQAAGALLNPALGTILVILEVVTALAIIGTALFGSDRLSARAVRLLCLFLKRQPAAFLPPALGASDSRSVSERQVAAPGGAEPGLGFVVVRPLWVGRVGHGVPSCRRVDLRCRIGGLRQRLHP